jgi:hypothetical protein
VDFAALSPRGAVCRWELDDRLHQPGIPFELYSGSSANDEDPAAPESPEPDAVAVSTSVSDNTAAAITAWWPAWPKPDAASVA